MPATGQAWTSLRRERGKHENGWKQDPHDDRIWSLYADPKVDKQHMFTSGTDPWQLGIGERAILIKTPNGNVLWDLFSYLDKPLIDFVSFPGQGLVWC